MVKEALILATEGGLVSDAPSSWSGDDLMPPVRVQIAEVKETAVTAATETAVIPPNLST